MPSSQVQYQKFSSRLYEKSVETLVPIRGQFALTYRCGLRCQMCYTDCYNSLPFVRKELPTEKILSLLEEIQEAGCLWLCFTGGDPLIHPDFEKIYLKAKEKGFLLTLFTNGISMTQEKVDFLSTYRPFVIEITQYGATQKTYETVTQIPGSFERFQAGIERILHHKLPLKLKAIVIRQNAHEFEAIKAFAHSVGASFRSTAMINPRLNRDLAPVAMRLSPEEILDLFYPEGSTDKTILPPPTPYRIRCGTGLNSFFIDPYGKLLFCATLEEPNYDLTKGSFQEGVRTLYPRMRTQMYRPDSLCRDCEIYALCDKCPAHIDGEGDPEQPVEFYCKIAHGRAKRLGIDVKRPVFWKDGKPTLHESILSPASVRSDPG